MKLVNLTETIKNLKGEEIKETDPKTKAEKPVFVKDVLASIAASGFEKPKPLEQVRLFRLAQRLMEAGESLTVNAESIELLKKCIDENRIGSAPLVIGQILLLSGLEIIDEEVAEAEKKA